MSSDVSLFAALWCMVRSIVYILLLHHDERAEFWPILNFKIFGEDGDYCSLQRKGEPAKKVRKKYVPAKKVRSFTVGIKTSERTFRNRADRRQPAHRKHAGEPVLQLVWFAKNLNSSSLVRTCSLIRLRPF